MALGKFRQEIIPLVKENSSVLDIASIFSQVVTTDSKNCDCPLLQGRALWFSSQYASVLPDHILKEFVSVAVQVMAQEQLGLRVFGVKAIKGFLSLGASGRFEEQAGDILAGLCYLAQSASNEFLFLLLETLTMAIKINEAATAEREHLLGPLIFTVWEKILEDVFMVEVLIDLFTALASSKLMSSQFQVLVSKCRLGCFHSC